MKFATYLNSKGQTHTLIVSKDNQSYMDISLDDGIHVSLSEIVKEWSKYSYHLECLSAHLNEHHGKKFNSYSLNLHAPLPNAPQWLDGSAYVTHVELVRKARGAELPESFWTDPLMYQGASDHFIGPNQPIEIADDSWGIDLEAEVAVVVKDVPMGCSLEEAAKSILLIMLVNDVSLRNLIPAELAKGFGFIHGKPTTSFSPLAVTPDELDNAYQDGKVHLPLLSSIKRKGKDWEELGRPNAGVDMTFNFPQLIAHAAKTRHLKAGTIIGSGTVANKNYKEVGSSCLAEKRMIEILEQGHPTTEFLKFGDRVKIEMLDKAGNNLFGTIDQEVQKYQR